MSNSGNFGLSLFGLDPYGSELATFAVVGASAFSPHLVRVQFSDLLDLSDPSVTDPNNYHLSPTLTVHSVIIESADSVLLATDGLSFVVYTVTVTEAHSLFGIPLVPPNNTAMFTGFPVIPGYFSIATTPTRIRCIFSEQMLLNAALTDPTSYAVSDLNSNVFPVLSAVPEQAGNPISVVLTLGTPMQTTQWYQTVLSPSIVTTHGQSPEPAAVDFQWVLPVQNVTVPISEFTGEVEGGPFGDPDGLVFFSPSLNVAAANSVIQVEDVSVCTTAFDQYTIPPQTPDPLPFFTWSTLGPKTTLGENGIVLFGGFPAMGEAKFDLGFTGGPTSTNHLHETMPPAFDGSCSIFVQAGFAPGFVALLNDPAWSLFAGNDVRFAHVDAAAAAQGGSGFFPPHQDGADIQGSSSFSIARPTVIGTETTPPMFICADNGAPIPPGPETTIVLHLAMPGNATMTVAEPVVAHHATVSMVGNSTFTDPVLYPLSINANSYMRVKRPALHLGATAAIINLDAHLDVRFPPQPIVPPKCDMIGTSLVLARAKVVVQASASILASSSMSANATVPVRNTVWVGDGAQSGFISSADPRYTTIRVLTSTSPPSLVASIDVSAFAPSIGFATIRMLRLSADGQHVLACMHTSPTNSGNAPPWQPGKVLFINKTTHAVEGVALLSNTAAGFQTVMGARDCVDTGDGHLWVLNATGGNTANGVETFNIATVLANGPGIPTTSFQQLAIPNHAEELAFDGTHVWTTGGNYTFTVSRIDISANTVSSYTGGRLFWGIFSAYGALWAGDSGNNAPRWYRLDPTQYPNHGFVTNTFVPTAPASDNASVQGGFASDGTNLWVSSVFSGTAPGGDLRMWWWEIGQTPTTVTFPRPRDQYYNPNTGYIWVADQGTDHVHVMDGLSGTWIADIPTNAVTGWTATRRIIGDLVYVYVAAPSTTGTTYNTLAIISQKTYQIVGLCQLPAGFQVRDIATPDDAVNLWVVGRNQSSSSLSKVYKFSISAALASYPTPVTPTVTSPSTRAYHVLTYEPITNTVFAGTKNQTGGEILAKLDPNSLADISTMTFTTSATFDWFEYLLANGGQTFNSVWAATDNPGILRINPSTFPAGGSVTTIPLNEGQFSSALFADTVSNAIYVGDDSGGQTIAHVDATSNTEVSHFTVTPALGGAAYTSSAVLVRRPSPGVPFSIWVTGVGNPTSGSGFFLFTPTSGSETQFQSIHSAASYPFLASISETAASPTTAFPDGSPSSGTYDSTNHRIWFVRWTVGGSSGSVFPGITSINTLSQTIDVSDFSGPGTGYWVGPRNILFVPP